VEEHGNFILVPVSPKEYKDTMTELHRSRTNRVFEFFKIVPPKRVGFAKHCDAAERKAVTLAIASADTTETAMSPHGHSRCTPSLHRALKRRRCYCRRPTSCALEHEGKREWQ
jgi:hypothetical protein